MWGFKPQKCFCVLIFRENLCRRREDFQTSERQQTRRVLPTTRSPCWRASTARCCSPWVGRPARPCTAGSPALASPPLHSSGSCWTAVSQTGRSSPGGTEALGMNKRNTLESLTESQHQQPNTRLQHPEFPKDETETRCEHGRISSQEEAEFLTDDRKPASGALETQLCS